MFSVSNTGGGLVAGIKNFGGNSVSVYRNNIYNLSVAAPYGMSNGLHIQWGTTVNIYNNMISGLTTPQSYFGGAIKGIYLEGGTNLNLYYNTIFLNATSTTSQQFGSMGIYANTSSIVDLRNNLVINLSTPVHINSDAYTTAYYRGGTSLTNYSGNSDNNSFYAGTPGPYNLIMYDGTNGYQTISDFKTLVTPRDVHSFTENTSFVNTASPPYDLHVKPTVFSLCESGGTVIVSPAINIDFDGNPRFPNTGYPDNPSNPAIAPDVGADEFAGCGNTSKSLNLTVFLEGLYNSAMGLMNQAMDMMGPHFGPGIADQVTVELHDAANYGTIVYTANNIDLGTAGTATVTIPTAFGNSYFITIRHRNSIETTSATPVSFAGSVISYDFTTAASQAYGNNLRGMNGGGVFAIWGGDVNQDGIVDAGDMNPVDNLSTAVTFGYVPEDANGDGIVDGGDMNIVDNNSTAIIMANVP